jgi:hypothetical protein
MVRAFVLVVFEFVVEHEKRVFDAADAVNHRALALVRRARLNAFTELLELEISFFRGGDAAVVKGFFHHF